MMLFNWIKVLHVISAAVLFGTGIGTVVYKMLANRTKNIEIISLATNHVVRAGAIFTAIAGFIQPISGLVMIVIKPYPVTMLWVFGSIIGYFVAALFWFPASYIQVKLCSIAKTSCNQNTKLPPHYYSYYKIWLALGWAAFISLIAVFFLMSNRPETFTDLLLQLKIK
jgi:uncharacterized membrane protein